MEITNTTDLILLHRWRASRDAEAFRALAERYAGLVFAAAHRVLRDPSEAEDVAQECFLTLAQARKPPERNLGAWLHAAAVNRAKNHIRGEVRRRLREQNYDALQPDHIQTELDDTLAHVDDAIAALGDELRHVIIAHFLEAKSQGEIADTTGVSRQTVNARVKRGVEAIREHLAKKGITATTASLTALLGTQMVEAAPASLVAALGKLALSGGAVAGGGVVASLVGLLTTKVAAGLAAILLAVLSFITYKEIVSRTRTPVDHPAMRYLNESAARTPSRVSDFRLQEPASGAVEVQPVSADVTDSGNLLSGTILDEDGGPMQRPVIVYALANFPQGLEMSVQSPERERFTRAHLLRQVESDDGVFELEPFTSIGVQGTIYAVDEVNNVMSEQLSFDLSSGDQRDITLRFHHYGAIAGTLRDRNDAPVTGATVMFRGPTGSFDAKVDEEGQFATVPLPPGEYELNDVLIGSLFDHEQNCIRFPMAALNVVVKEGEQVDSIALLAKCEMTHISGRVVDEHGRGIPDLRLLLSYGDFEPGTQSQVDRLFGATDSRGTFDLSVYGPGRFKLDLVSADFELSEPIAVRSGEVDLEIQARVGGRKPIRFHVVDGRNGKIVESATFRLPGPIKGSGSTTTFSDGRFSTTMRAEEAKDATVTFSSEGIGVATYAIKPTDLGGPEILISLQPIQPVQGQVLDSEGNPKANVRIHDIWVSEWEPRTRTDAEGRFSLTDLDPGQEVIYLFSEDEPQMSAPIVREGEWVIRLPRGVEISGTVLVNGRPLEGVTMNLSSRTEGVPRDAEKHTQTDAHGYYQFQGVAPGEGTVRAHVQKGEGKSILGTIEKSVAVTSGTPKDLDFSVELRSFDATLLGMLYEGGQPAVGTINIRREDGDDSQNASFIEANAEEGFRIADLVAGDVEITANLGRCRRTFTHHLTAGENSVDIHFPKCGAALECTFPVSDGNEVSVTTIIVVETEFGEETIVDTQSVESSSGIRIEDLPEGTATISVQASHYNRGYERRVKLISGATATIDFSTDNALIDFILSGVQDSEQVVVFAFPGSPVLPGAGTPDIYMAQLNSLQPIAFLERPYLGRPLKHLEAGTYTLVACAFPGETDPASGSLTQGFRTYTTEVTLVPGSEAQVTLAFP